MQLRDQVAIVTGGASLRGIGRATAKRFADEGARVAVLDIGAVAAEQAARAIGPQHPGLACDVRNEALCMLAAQQVLDAFGRIGILVNSAGVSQSHRLLDSTRADYDLVMDASVRGAYNMSRAVVPHMRSRQRGAIVCMGSVAAQRRRWHTARSPGAARRHRQCLPVPGLGAIRVHHGCGARRERRHAHTLSVSPSGSAMCSMPGQTRSTSSSLRVRLCCTQHSGLFARLCGARQEICRLLHANRSWLMGETATGPGFRAVVDRLPQAAEFKRLFGALRAQQHSAPPSSSATTPIATDAESASACNAGQTARAAGGLRHTQVMPLATQWPALRGGLTALTAALLFGASTPLVQRFGAGIGSFTTAALLYAGAALVGALLRRPLHAEARLQRSDAPRLAWMALFGAVIGPVALAWGLQHTSGTSASLMLTLEAVFTAVLARLWYRETLDRRVIAALALLTLGGMVLVADVGAVGASPLLGLLAVLAATAAWGVDNTLSRGVATRDPGQVVLAKGALGATATTLLALLLSEPVPGPWPALALLTVGATGYGLSLRFYLLAQRAFGAARTGSVFAFAPFVGAVLAFSLGERSASLWLLAAAGLMVAGILLHLAESHGHDHVHDAAEHEHAHGHDDGHHGHPHEPHDPGPHSHRHQHTPVQHTHAHVPDEHHGHRH